MLKAVQWLKITQITSLLVIIVLGVIITRSMSDSHASSDYPLLAKRLFGESSNDILVNFVDLRTRLREYVAKSPEKIGLYFEYLPTGVSINVGANDEFFRASLVKLPSVMRAYKLVEEKRLSFDEVLTVETEQLNSDFGELWKRGAGTKLTVKEIIDLILNQSDNTAFNVLHQRVNVDLLKDTTAGDQSIDDVYDYLDIPRESEGITPMISPKNFSSILKSLYFSAYVTFEHSNEILSTMTKEHAQQWLRSGVPASVTVADKIGVYDINDPVLRVHSNCGIVYVPSRQYALCVMINSDDTEKSARHIQDISKMVYEYVTNQTPHVNR